MAVTTPTSPEIEIENGGGGGGSPTTSPTTTTTTTTGLAPEGKTPAPGPSGPSTPQYKYLVLNHADTPNVKTILKYQYPDAPATAGYVHFNTNGYTDPLSAGLYGQSWFPVSFEFAGTTPIQSQFTISDSWITIGNFSTDTTTNTGSMSVSVGNNSDPSSTPRTGTITFSGDNSGATSATNNNVLTINQTGNVTNTKNNY